MRAGKLLVFTAVVLLLLLLARAFTTLDTSPPPRTAAAPGREIGVSVHLRVERVDGRVEEYAKPDDPLLYNWWALLGNVFFGLRYTNPLTVYMVNGTTFFDIDWEYNRVGTSDVTGLLPNLLIGIGSGSTAVSFMDYELSSLITRLTVPSSGYNCYDNNTHVVVTATINWTASSSVTVREVGLYWGGFRSGSSTRINVLIARDLITPVTLNAGDRIFVTYVVAIRYNNAPMLRNLARMIANYLLGARFYGKSQSYTATDGISSMIIDFGTERSTSPFDTIQEVWFVHATDSTSGYSPTGYSWTDRGSINAQPVFGYNGTHVWYSVYVEFYPTVRTVRGIYIRITTDYSSGTAVSTLNIIILYFPVSTITLEEGQVLYFDATIYFRWN